MNQVDEILDEHVKIRYNDQIFPYNFDFKLENMDQNTELKIEENGPINNNENS